jgi:hypothetical protein
MTKPTASIDMCFLLIAALSLCAGTALGLAMGLTGDFGLRPIHAHANLLGWASLALFGLFYRAYPDAAAGRLAHLHLLASGASAVLLPIGLWLELQQLDHVLISVASAVWAIGAIIFLIIVACSFARARQTCSDGEFPRKGLPGCHIHFVVPRKLGALRHGEAATSRDHPTQA